MRSAFVGFLTTEAIKERIRSEALKDGQSVSSYLYQHFLKHFDMPDETNPSAETMIKGGQ